jgi:hypothetical protein
MLLDVVGLPLTRVLEVLFSCGVASQHESWKNTYPQCSQGQFAAKFPLGFHTREARWNVPT